MSPLEESWEPRTRQAGLIGCRYSGITIRGLLTQYTSYLFPHPLLPFPLRATAAPILPEEPERSGTDRNRNQPGAPHAVRL